MNTSIYACQPNMNISMLSVHEGKKGNQSGRLSDFYSSIYFPIVESWEAEDSHLPLFQSIYRVILIYCQNTYAVLHDLIIVYLGSFRNLPLPLANQGWKIRDKTG
jgi:hypothetical protein